MIVTTASIDRCDRSHNNIICNLKNSVYNQFIKFCYRHENKAHGSEHSWWSFITSFLLYSIITVAEIRYACTFTSISGHNYDVVYNKAGNSNW